MAEWIDPTPEVEDETRPWIAAGFESGSMDGICESKNGMMVCVLERGHASPHAEYTDDDRGGADEAEDGLALAAAWGDE